MSALPRVRAAHTDDIERLASFNEAMAWETEHKRLDAATVRRGVAAVFERAHRGRYLVAELEGETVGALMHTYEWSDWRDGDWWWIQSVYVVEHARRRGVFRALYEHLRGDAERSPGVCGLRLYVEHENRTAQATYAALGMVDAGYRMLEYALPRVAASVQRSVP